MVIIRECGLYENYILCIIFIIWWINCSIKENLLQDDPMLHYLKELISPIDPTFKNLKLYKGSKSYTINKKHIYLCLKDENNNYYPINMLIYVTLHEVAHLLNKHNVGHTEKFHEIFQELIDKATELGIYNPLIKPIEQYCNYND